MDTRGMWSGKEMGYWMSSREAKPMTSVMELWWDLERGTEAIGLYFWNFTLNMRIMADWKIAFQLLSNHIQYVGSNGGLYLYGITLILSLGFASPTRDLGEKCETLQRSFVQAQLLKSRKWALLISLPRRHTADALHLVTSTWATHTSCVSWRVWHASTSNQKYFTD